jgi:hypothetical protein
MLWRHVVWQKFANVSEERTASIFRVKSKQSNIKKQEMVGFTPRMLYPRRYHGTQQTGGWLRPRTGLKTVARGEISLVCARNRIPIPWSSGSNPGYTNRTVPAPPIHGHGNRCIQIRPETLIWRPDTQALKFESGDSYFDSRNRLHCHYIEIMRVEFWIGIKYNDYVYPCGIKNWKRPIENVTSPCNFLHKGLLIT